MPNLFPNFSPSGPDLLKACEAEIIDLASYLPNALSGEIWTNILSKVESGDALTPRETLSVLFNQSRLPDDAQRGKSKSLVWKCITESAYKRAVHSALQKFDRRALSILLDRRMKKLWRKAELPSGVIRYQASIVGEDYGNLATKILASGAIENSLAEFEVTGSRALQDGIVHDLLENQAAEAILVEFQEKSFEFLIKVLASQTLALTNLDQLCANFMASHPTWRDQISLPQNVLHKVAKQLRSQRFNSETLSGLLAITELLTVFRAHSSVLRDLYANDQERAKFWSEFIERAEAVVCNSNLMDSGVQVAVAFYFKEIVIVEFGPKGNAAYVYNKDVFDTKIRGDRFWKVQRLGKRVPGYTQDDGRLRHVDGWQQRFGTMINIYGVKR